MGTARKFDWHDVKAAKTEAERGITFEFAAGVFLDPAHVDIDASRPGQGEERRKVIGMIEERLYVVVYTMRGDVTWIISARRVNKKERRIYGSICP
jgi:uncharacterized DUF497 family protein